MLIFFKKKQNKTKLKNGNIESKRINNLKIPNAYSEIIGQKGRPD